MKKTLMILTFIFFLSSLSLFAQSTPVATVKMGSKTEIITREDFNNRVRAIEMQMGRSIPIADQKQVLKGMIGENLLYLGAVEVGVKSSENEMISMLKQQIPGASGLSTAEFKEAYEEQTGQSWAAAKVQLEKSFIVQKFIREKSQPQIAKIKDPTDSELREFYNKNKAQMVTPDLAQVKHIFFNSQARKETEALKEANNVYDELVAKKITFEEAVNRYSDDIQSKSVGGLLGGGVFITYGNPQTDQILGTAFVDTAMNTKEGTFSKPVKSPSGYHIIYVEKRIPAQILSFDGTLPMDPKVTVKDSLKYQFKSMEEQNIVKEVLDKLTEDLEKRATIQILDKSLE